MRRPGLLVALDVPTAEEAVAIAEVVLDQVDGFKVGLELLLGPGPGVVTAIGDLGKPVFVDAKLHDIPNTVGRAARQLGRFGARWVSAHASGGKAMLEAAADGLCQGAGGAECGILAITVLTSLDQASLATVGVTGSPGRQVSRLAKLAAEVGSEGVVCAVSEIGTVVQVAPSLLTVTPGIRPPGADPHDQARVATPQEAAERGAGLVVVGRPITTADDPAQAAAEIAAAIAVPAGG